MTREEALTALGLEGDATQDEITAAYRELAQMLHPDKYGTSKRLRERAEQQMRVINEARDTLLRGRAARRPASTSAVATAQDIYIEATIPCCRDGASCGGYLPSHDEGAASRQDHHARYLPCCRTRKLASSWYSWCAGLFHFIHACPMGRG